MNWNLEVRTLNFTANVSQLINKNNIDEQEHNELFELWSFYIFTIL